MVKEIKDKNVMSWIWWTKIKKKKKWPSRQQIKTIHLQRRKGGRQGRQDKFCLFFMVIGIFGPNICGKGG